ncbi:MAG: CDP-alcohol phosphatidyltransferase family protein [Melioribacter sp.]|nr:CDP-alcohol phosphatidyltransferase family protein [Melioribacter sp.]
MNSLKKFFEDFNTIPNYISLFRLLLAIPFYFLLDAIQYDFLNRYYVLGLIFIASLSDILDGIIARKLNKISEFGKIIDPLADKVLIILIVTKLYLMGEIISLYFFIIVGRDILIFLGGIWISKKIGRVLPSNLIGKLTVISIGVFIIITVSGTSKFSFLYNSFFYLSIILSFISVIAYGLRAYEALKWKKNEIS